MVASCLIYEKDAEELSLRGFSRDKKHVSFLPAGVFIHKKIKTFWSMQMILKPSSLSPAIAVSMIVSFAQIIVKATIHRYRETGPWLVDK